MLPIERLAALPSPSDFTALCILLGDAVEGGASVGFRTHRGRGLGSALVRAAEAAAAQARRSLLVLDTSATGNAVGLYERCGYIRGGAIPRYACNPDGPLIDTLFYYRHLDAK